MGLEDLLRQAHRRIEYSSPQFAEYIVDRLGIALQALSAILAPLDGQGDDELILIRSQLEDIMACCRSLRLLWQSYRDEMDSHLHEAAAEEAGFRVTCQRYAWTSPCSDNRRSIDLPSHHEFFLVQHC